MHFDQFIKDVLKFLSPDRETGKDLNKKFQIKVRTLCLKFIVKVTMLNDKITKKINNSSKFLI